MTFTRKDILGTQDMNASEIAYILDATESFIEVSMREVKKVPTLRGKTIINLFYPPDLAPTAHMAATQPPAPHTSWPARFQAPSSTVVMASTSILPRPCLISSPSVNAKAP